MSQCLSNSLSRYGVFPFFKLPIEVRKMILRELLDPFYHTSLRDPHESCIEIEVGYEIMKEGRLALYDRDENDQEWLYEYWNIELRGRDGKSYTRRIASPPIERWTTEDFDKAKASYIYARWADNQRMIPQPSRTLRPRRWNFQQQVQDTMKVSIPMRTVASRKPRRSTLDWAIIELLRQLSNLSPQFRLGLGEVFWERVHVKYEANDLDLEPVLKNFLRSRPVIHFGVKHLSLTDDLPPDFWERSYGRRLFRRTT
jgi:hypothetical protein